MFECYQMDDFLALCIGAFWLTEPSWKQFGHTIHITTAMGINRSVRKACVESPQHFERAQTWYLLNICHCYFSISYRRLPVIYDHELMCKEEPYLE